MKTLHAGSAGEMIIQLRILALSLAVVLEVLVLSTINVSKVGKHQRCRDETQTTCLVCTGKHLNVKFRILDVVG